MLTASQIADKYIPQHPKLALRGWVVTECGWVCRPSEVARYNALYGASKSYTDAADVYEAADEVERARIWTQATWQPPKHRWAD